MTAAVPASLSRNVLTRDECEALGKRVFGMVSGNQAQLNILSRLWPQTHFARGDARESIDRTLTLLTLTVDVGGRRASATTVQDDDDALRALVATAESAAREWRGPASEWTLLPEQHYAEPLPRFFESTLAAMGGEHRAQVCRAVLERSRAAGVIAAGSMGFWIEAMSLQNTKGLFAYDRYSGGFLSLTARTKDGTGSGKATGGDKDWSGFEPMTIVDRAIDLAKRSANPVAIEPGRYTVILEPAAVGELLGPLRYSWVAEQADQGLTVFSKEPRGTNKIGLKMIDARLSMVSDPWDPIMPTSTWAFWTGQPITGPVKWFEDGVLKELHYYDPKNAKLKGREPFTPAPNFRLQGRGPETSLEEMIATTKRGIWVNWLDGGSVANWRTLLSTGTTRNGTFLIENGKITKPIKNFRFTESPFFVLNKLESFGESMPTNDGVMPRLKVRDFEFTSLTDAV